MRAPRSKLLVLDGSNAQQARIEGATEFSVSPRSTTTVNIAIDGNPESASQFFQLVNGQAFSARARQGEVFDPFTIGLFASAGVSVDIVWW